jgi:hypothetical protein
VPLHLWGRSMALELHYAVPPPPMIGRKIVGMLMLVLGIAAYAALCWPAMHRRGYPPMDHFWLGMAYLRVFPVPLFTLICPPGKLSRRVLTLYALATAYAVLTHGGTVSRWGGSFTSGSNDLDVETRLGGTFGASGYSGNAAVGHLAKYPGVIFVRGGDKWIAAASDDGWILNGAMISP